jgi:hypothetical protein
MYPSIGAGILDTPDWVVSLATVIGKKCDKFNFFF